MSSLTGTPTLVRLALRRDRFRLPLWIVGIVAISGASARAVTGTYDTPSKIANYGPTVGTSATSRITSGAQVALDTLGGIAANEITLVATLGVTIMMLFTVVRHTRAEEESGAAELVRSGVIGRHAATAAALLVSMPAALLVGALLTATLVAMDLELTGAVAFGTSVAALGFVFAAIAAAAAQVTAATRGALAIAGGLLGATYVVRGVGAVGDNALYWLSPFGWAQGVDAFGHERWWLLGVLAAATLAFLALAAALAARRDAGAGLVQPRAGDARASAWLGTPWGLALRTQRGLVIGWALGLAVLAAIYGSVVPDVPDMLAGNDDLATAMGLGVNSGEDLIDAFLGYINLSLGVIGAIFGVSSVLRLRADEDSGRLEAVLATGLTRWRWLAGTLAVTVVGTVLMAVVMGLGMVLGYVSVAGDGARNAELTLGLLAQLPGMLVIASLTFVLVAWIPRQAMLAWLVMAWVTLVAFLGETLNLPEAARATSPFHHLSAYPAEPWVAGTALALLAVAVGLTALGSAGYRRRDVG